MNRLILTTTAALRSFITPDHKMWEKINVLPESECLGYRHTPHTLFTHPKALSHTLKTLNMVPEGKRHWTGVGCEW